MFTRRNPSREDFYSIPLLFSSACPFLFPGLCSAPASARRVTVGSFVASREASFPFSSVRKFLPLWVSYNLFNSARPSAPRKRFPGPQVIEPGELFPVVISSDRLSASSFFPRQPNTDSVPPFEARHPAFFLKLCPSLNESTPFFAAVSDHKAAAPRGPSPSGTPATEPDYPPFQ